MLGCREVGIEEPTASKDLLVYVEIDRCASEAIQSVTGCKLGKRTLKYFDYGKMAATFLNLNGGEAVRIAATDDSREAVSEYAPSGLDKKRGQLHAYKAMPDERLFNVMPVCVDVSPADMPGRPISRVMCDACGEGVNDAREVKMHGRVLCRPCAHGGYYRLPDPVVWDAGE